MTRKHRDGSAFEFDVCLSFAGEDRPYVDSVAQELRSKGVRVFYDEYERTRLWGKDLFQHLDDVYQNAARYCVLFASKHYAEKIWTNHELQSAQARALRENREYILPARFDDTKIPGLRGTVGHIDLKKISPPDLADMICRKLGPQIRGNFLPPEPDRLFKSLRDRSAKSRERAKAQAQDFLLTLQRLSADERRLVCAIFVNGCQAELPGNVHINIDFLQRIIEFPRSKICRLLGKIRSLGFLSRIRTGKDAHDEYLGSAEDVALEWNLLREKIGGNLTPLAIAMIRGATEGCCEECGANALDRLDFSQLSSATFTEE